VAELILSIIVDILGHVPIQYLKGSDVCGAPTSPWHFTVLDSAQFVVLLPQIAFDDFDRSQEPENGDVSFGVEDSYSPSNTSTTVFDQAFLKVDSSQAFETAQKHGGDKLLEKSPDTPILYVVDWNRQTNELTWHVIYGTDAVSAKLRVAVNASSGDFLRVEK